MFLPAVRSRTAVTTGRLSFRCCSNASSKGSNADKFEKPLTQRELYKAAVANASSNKQKGLQGAGGVLALGGAGVLVWQHWAAVASWNTLGGGLMLAGVAIAQAAGGSSRLGRASGDKSESKFKLTLLNDTERWKADNEALQKLVGGDAWPAASELVKADADEKKKEQSRVTKALKEHETSVQNALKAGETAVSIQARLRPRTFVFNFDAGGRGLPSSGGMKKRLEELRDTVTFILQIATPHDEVVLRLYSPGGPVADYGLAAAQLVRFRRSDIKLTACVDKVAASGGYMMACTASDIVAAPFSMVGSIGVLAQMPNFAKLLQRNDIDFLQFTGGRWKRTVDPLTPPTEEGKAKMKEDVARIHEAFKSHVAGQRGTLDIEEVATGEVFLGLEAKDRGLVDRVATSDEVLAEKMKVSDVVEITLAPKKKGVKELLEGKVESAEGFLSSLWHSVVSSNRSAVALESRDPKI
eukprot:TRINITY_DN36242_c0_g1_i2.p1 TRINITY_DN36242_c0_g1~~TRINITY_DN36242_c0_g1_i2.p1  ORF type:complete len:486 (-),score=122.72 TRINITY_DN36242_c0_g1_i2:65-1471(-)